MSKQLIDGTEIPDAIYYYVLDYNDRLKEINRIRWFIHSIGKMSKEIFIQFTKDAIKDDLKHI